MTFTASAQPKETKHDTKLGSPGSDAWVFPGRQRRRGRTSALGLARDEIFQGTATTSGDCICNFFSAYGAARVLEVDRETITRATRDLPPDDLLGDQVQYLAKRHELVVEMMKLEK